MNDDTANPNPAPEASPSSAGPYDCVILQSIGRGAYGEVYLARDTSGNYRALKVISRQSFDHDRPFEREYDGIRKFESVSRLDPNQIQIFSVGRRESPREFYYLMELADDTSTGRDIHPDAYVPKTLRSELKRRGCLPGGECVTLGLALAHAVDSLHRGGLIHRDIKPANIIFVSDIPKLADIGLVTDADLSVSHVGTEGFIAPEGPGSVSSDLYSLGKVLYEMCTGLDRMDFPDLPANFEDFPDRALLLELNAVVAKACDRHPRNRYRNARELAADLQLLQRGGSVRQKRLVRRRLAFAGTAALSLAVAGSLVAGAVKLRALLAHPKPVRRIPIPDDPRNLIVNGSFEKPTIPLGDRKLGLFIVDATNLLPWHATVDTFEVWADDVVTPGLKFIGRSVDGFQNLEILSTLPDNTIWQTVKTIPGERYVFSFYHTPRPEVDSTLTVSVNSDLIGIFEEKGAGLTKFEWHKFTTNFIATSQLTTVSFSDRSSKHQAVGTHIDAVVLMPASAQNTDQK